MPVLIIKDCKSAAQKNALLDLKSAASSEQFINLVPEGSAAQCELVGETIYHKKSFGGLVYIVQLVLRLRALNLSSIVILFDNSSFKGHTNVKIISLLCGCSDVTGISIDGKKMNFTRSMLVVGEFGSMFHGLGEKLSIGLFVFAAVPVLLSSFLYHKLFPKPEKRAGKIKVLVLLWSLKGNGVTNVVLSILAGIDRDRFEPAVFAPLGGVMESEVRNACGNTTVLGDANLAKVLFALYGYIKDEKADIIHTHSYQLGFMAQFWGWVMGIPVILHEHSEIKYRSKLLRLIGSFLAKGDSVFVSVSKMVEKRVRKLYNLNSGSSLVIYNGIDTGYYKSMADNKQAKKMLGIPLDMLVIGSTGRLVTEKGYHIMMQALALLDKDMDYRCLICGGGPEEDRLKSMAKEFGLTDKIIFMGFQKELVSICSSFDIFVKPSFSETQSLSVVEGMSMGLPVIATDIECITEYIKDGVNGIIVKTGNPRDIAKAIEKLAADAALRRSLGAEARKTAIEMFDKQLFNTNINRLLSNASIRHFA